MNNEINGLTLNNRFFSTKELLAFCHSETDKKRSAAWQLDIYRFILDFLNDSEFVIQKTSGSTGTPKTIQLPKKAMLASAKLTTTFFQLKKSDVAVLCLPVKYIAGKMMIVRALYKGLNLHMIEPSGSPDFTGLDKIDFCAMVPLQAANLLQQNTWPEIKTLILGGVQTGTELAEKLGQVKTRVFETYGMAETCSHIALKQINAKVPETSFTTLPGIAISTDERDCLQIAVPFLAERVQTNDCVELISDNQFRWIGRFDSVINTGGIKIQTEMLEIEIQNILQIPCAVVGVPDVFLTEKVVLFLETGLPIEEKKLLEKLSKNMDKKVLPKLVYALKSFPRNQSFKIDRIKLREFVIANEKAQR